MNSTISERILKVIQESNLSYGELSLITGIPKAALQRYATGTTLKVPIDRIELIAQATNTSAKYLMGWEESTPKIEDFFDVYPVEKQKKLPVYGAVSAGKGVFAEEDIIGYEYVDEQYNNDEYFYLQVQGSSMSPRIENGDLVLVHKQSSVDSGSVGVFLVDDTDGFIKKV
ncbi:MAG: hypothetical protein IJO52_00075, partial [Clostridia bacterium]|nr:hypothetical protein [Clostridia bacterium]